MAYNIALRLWSVVLAVTCAIMFSIYIIRPYVLEPMSLVDTNASVRISYQQINNSVLVNMAPTQYWWWFNGQNIYVYGLPTGRLCEQESEEENAVYEPAFVINGTNARLIGYQCIIRLEDLKTYYKKAPINYLFTRPKKTNFNIYDAINLLVSRNIIVLPAPDKPSPAVAEPVETLLDIS